MGKLLSDNRKFDRWTVVEDARLLKQEPDVFVGENEQK
jgi:hypothetical protein